MLRNIFLIATSAVGISALATRPDASTFQDSFKVWIRDQTGSNSSSYFARVFEGAVGWASSEFLSRIGNVKISNYGLFSLALVTLPDNSQLAFVGAFNSWNYFGINK